MEKGPQEAFDAMRKHLQQILMRAESCQGSPHCESCARTVGEIVEEIRTLEAFVREMSKKSA